MSSAERIVYLTVDGLLQALGFSQVVRVVEALALRGWKYEVISLEREVDLNREAAVRDLRLRLKARGVDWKPLPYQSGGSAAAALANEQRLVASALDSARRGALGFHARAYHGASAALAAWYGYGTKWLFDARSYWFDERLEEGRWFTTPIRLGIARGVEHQFFSCATGVVTLTELQAEDVRSGRFGPSRHRAVQCITTCADFDDFTRRPLESLTSVPPAIREQLRGRRVLGIVGSINRSYLVDETLQLARQVLKLEPNAHLLILTSQEAEYAERLKAVGVDLQRVTIARASHKDMPQWLSLMEWGLLLLQPGSPAKRASMPTKLGEFFAAGVRPAQFGCNEEVSSWVEQAGSGVVLTDVTRTGLDQAARFITSAPVTPELLGRARERVRGHFSLESGITKYERVLGACFDRKPR